MEGTSSPRVPPTPLKDKFETGMTFAECLEKLVLGEKCRRLEWEDSEVYITIKDERLMIYRTDDKMLHPLTVSTGDIQGTDWVVVVKRDRKMAAA
jgi:hypothetical protein